MIHSLQEFLDLVWHQEPDDPRVSYAWDFPDSVDPWAHEDSWNSEVDNYDLYRRVADGQRCSYDTMRAYDCFRFNDASPAIRTRTSQSYVQEIREHAQSWWPETIDQTDLDMSAGGSDCLGTLWSVVVKDGDDYRILDRWLWRSWSYRVFVVSGDEERYQWIHAGPFASTEEAETMVLDGHCVPTDEEVAALLSVRVDDVATAFAALLTPDGDSIWKFGDRLFCTDGSVGILHPEAQLLGEYGYDSSRACGATADGLLRAKLLWSMRTGEEPPSDPWILDSSRRKPDFDSETGEYIDPPADLYVIPSSVA